MTAFSLPSEVRTIAYRSPSKGGLFVDTTTANVGYVTAGRHGDLVREYGRLKFQVRKGEQTYNYDLPTDRGPAQYPMNMGSGTYTLRVMENVGGNRYTQLSSVSRQVKLTSRFAPFLIPTMFCEYAPYGPLVLESYMLCGTCKTELQALNAVDGWVAGNVAYDERKAKELAKSTGYVPDPDATFMSGVGVCFDYAALEAAMLRCVGIPCKLITGYIDGGLYHAWVSAHANGRWRRRDPTLKAAGKRSDTYTRRFVY